MLHHCHAHECKEEVPPRMMMCRIHWFALRKALRDAVWREYKNGQEKSKTPTARYMAVQQRAIEKGQGDPLDGLTENPPTQQSFNWEI